MSVSKNSELLFLYDAEMCNPNGDPDNENRPRMDTTTSTNIVTDVRVKRYIRDYIEQYSKKLIYLTHPEGNVLNATDRLKFWKWRKANPTAEVDLKKIREFKLITDGDEVLDDFIDIRLFGVTLPIKADKKGEKGDSIAYIGPIQLNWGKSLNEVELVESNAITTHLSSETGTQGSMGVDYRVYYSLLAVHGIISAKRAVETKLTEDDIKVFDNAIIKSIPLLATRSKIGQYPRLYVRVVFNDDMTFIGDLRKYVKLVRTKGLRTFKDIQFDLTDLIKKLNEHKNEIEKCLIWADPSLDTKILLKGLLVKTENL